MPAAYPDFEPLGLQHQDEVTRLLEEAQPVTSELTFTNLFIWRHHYRFRLARLEGCLLVLGQPPGADCFLLPPVGPGAAKVCRRLLAEPKVARKIARVPEDYLSRCELTAAEFTITEEEGQADYVYLTSDLIRLEGRRYAGKRNHLRRFRTLYRWEYRKLDAGLVPGCLRLTEDWCRVRVCPRELGLAAERVAIWEALESFGRLGCAGGAVLVEGQVAAFSLGERLNQECAVIHIEKANPELEGIYQAINQQFLEHELGAFKFINREQDLGDMGLRRAKLSYQPHHLVRKYVLTAR
jgi:hypothetical protein